MYPGSGAMIQQSAPAALSLRRMASARFRFLNTAASSMLKLHSVHTRPAASSDRETNHFPVRRLLR